MQGGIHQELGDSNRRIVLTAVSPYNGLGNRNHCHSGAHRKNGQKCNFERRIFKGLQRIA